MASPDPSTTLTPLTSVPSSAHNPRANVFIIVNLGCEMLFVIDQRLQAQKIAKEKSIQGRKCIFFQRKLITSSPLQSYMT